MQTRIQRWGNSLALRIPKAFADEIGLTAESAVEMTITNGQILLKPVTRPMYDLDELLAQITEDNLHSEIDTGESTGNETW